MKCFLNALSFLAVVTSLSSVYFWFRSAKKPLALLDTIQDEMIEAARRNRQASWAAFSAALFQGLTSLQWLLGPG
jgi:hypothetical protein